MIELLLKKKKVWTRTSNIDTSKGRPTTDETGDEIISAAHIWWDERPTFDGTSGPHLMGWPDDGTSHIANHSQRSMSNCADSPDWRQLSFILIAENIRDILRTKCYHERSKSYPPSAIRCVFFLYVRYFIFSGQLRSILGNSHFCKLRVRCPVARLPRGMSSHGACGSVTPLLGDSIRFNGTILYTRYYHVHGGGNFGSKLL